jgi:crotonobetainyl-CoA hydratase
MMAEFLKLTRNGQILEIVLDRPKANALDTPASREMGKL